MELKDDSSKEALEWLDSSDDDDSRLYCHSAMYGVKFDVAKTPGTLVGHEAGTALSTKQLITVGSSLIDVILAHCRVHKVDKGDDQVSEMNHLEEDITKLHTLLTANCDDVDSHIAATDLLNTQSFTHLDGGTLWKFKETSNNSKPKVPSTRQQERIDDLNRLQVLLDAANREARLLRWKLFAYWWCFVNSRQQMQEKDKYAASVQNVRKRLFELIGEYDYKGQLVASKSGRIQEPKDQIELPRSENPVQMCLRTKGASCLRLYDGSVPCEKRSYAPVWWHQISLAALHGKASYPSEYAAYHFLASR